jgi:3-oxoacyl-[acyl-carrier-protein] synthase II
MLVLEREERARARGATILRRSTATDRPATRTPRPDGAGGEEIARAMRGAISAGRRPEEIGYVNYHGTSTVLNDAVESRCVRQLFGAHAEQLAGSSVKSMIGHPQGASGAAGVVTAALALSRGFLPPTINLREADPACDLDVIPNQGRAAGVEAALCNCLGFGSKNSALVIGRA